MMKQPFSLPDLGPQKQFPDIFFKSYYWFQVLTNLTFYDHLKK